MHYLKTDYFIVKITLCILAAMLVNVGVVNATISIKNNHLSTNKLVSKFTICNTTEGDENIKTQKQPNVEAKGKILPTEMILKNPMFFNDKITPNIVGMNEVMSIDYNKYTHEENEQIDKMITDYKFDDKLFYTYFLPKAFFIENQDISIKKYAKKLETYLKFNPELLKFAPELILKFDSNNDEQILQVFSIQTDLGNVIK